MRDSRVAPNGTGSGETSCRLVTLTTADHRSLHGALYEPAREPIASMLHLHGKGGNFYSGPGRFVPEMLAGHPFRHLSLNLRSHDLAYTRDDAPYQDFESGSTEADGGYWEDLETGGLDIGAGVDFLLDADSRVPLFLSGHSSGGFYAATYSPTDPRVSAQILLSSVIDNKRALAFWFPRADELDEACAVARRMVERGDGRSLLPLRQWYYAISANTLLQRAAQPDDIWHRALQQTRIPTLFVWGARETRANQWSAVYESLPDMSKRRLVLANCGHDYAGHQPQVAEGIATFVFDAVQAGPIGTTGTSTRNH